MRRLLPALALLAVTAAPTGAAVRLADDAEVHALTISREQAVAAIDSGDPQTPFSLVRSSGRGSSEVTTFGEPGAGFPDLGTADRGTVVATWARPVSGGNALSAQALGSEPVAIGVSTGPAKVAGTALAFPDRDGNIAIATLAAPEPIAVTSNAPERRHLALDAGEREQGTLVLDLVQRRTATELWVLGPGAPPAVVAAVPALRHLPASMAVEEELIAVAYLKSGRAYVARSRGGAWRTRRLPGEKVTGTPAVAIAGGDVLVAYSRRAGSSREIFVSDVAGTRQLTTAPGDDRDPVAAGGPGGEAFVAWTRRRGDTATAFLERLD